MDQSKTSIKFFNKNNQQYLQGKELVMALGKCKASETAAKFSIIIEFLETKWVPAVQKTRAAQGKNVGARRIEEPQIATQLETIRLAEKTGNGEIVKSSEGVKSTSEDAKELENLRVLQKRTDGEKEGDGENFLQKENKLERLLQEPFEWDKDGEMLLAKLKQLEDQLAGIKGLLVLVDNEHGSDLGN